MCLEEPRCYLVSIHINTDVFAGFQPRDDTRNPAVPNSNSNSNNDNDNDNDKFKK